MAHIFLEPRTCARERPVAQNGFNYDGIKEEKRAHQNFKLVPWSAIREGLKLPALAAPAESVPVEAAPETAKPN